MRWSTFIIFLLVPTFLFLSSTVPCSLLEKGDEKRREETDRELRENDE